MRYDSWRHHRRSLRLKNFDYASKAAYFVTICTKDREHLLGEVTNGQVILNKSGHIVDETWHQLPGRFSQIILDQWVIMPNHIHGIIQIVGATLGSPRKYGDLAEGAASSAPTGLIIDNVICRDGACLAPNKGAPQLGHIIRAFKSISAVAVNKHLGHQDRLFWQRNYYERVIRNEDELNRIRQYIQDNPANWSEDPENVAV